MPFNNLNNFEFGFNLIKQSVQIKYPQDTDDYDDMGKTIQNNHPKSIKISAAIVNSQNPNTTYTNYNGGYLGTSSLVMMTKVNDVPRNATVINHDQEYQITGKANATGTNIYYYQLKRVDNDD